MWAGNREQTAANVKASMKKSVWLSLLLRSGNEAVVVWDFNKKHLNMLKMCGCQSGWESSCTFRGQNWLIAFISEVTSAAEGRGSVKTSSEMEGLFLRNEESAKRAQSVISHL